VKVLSTLSPNIPVGVTNVGISISSTVIVVLVATFVIMWSCTSITNVPAAFGV